MKNNKFAKEAMKNSLRVAIRSGKNPITGRKFTKKQIAELKSLLKIGELK